MHSTQEDVTQLLIAWNQGDEEALNQLLPLIYDELRRLARNYLRHEPSGHTLQTTALVHEAYLRLIAQRNVSWQNRAHFLGIAAQMMRRILVNHALAKLTDKRGGTVHKVSLQDHVNLAEQRAIDLMALEEALKELESLDQRQCRIVELRFFGGLSIEETAEVLGASPATVKREWSVAKMWLHREISRRG